MPCGGAAAVDAAGLTPAGTADDTADEVAAANPAPPGPVLGGQERLPLPLQSLPWY